jgi:serine/threonine protein kinase
MGINMRPLDKTSPETNDYETVGPWSTGEKSNLSHSFEHHRYQVLGELGSGGFGVVLKAQDRELQRVVAIKLERAPEKRGTAFLRQEARMAALLRHPAIVSVYDFGTLADGRAYIVSEFIDGPSLARQLKERGPLPAKEACELMSRVAEALHHIHEQGLTHRDLKPANILLSSDGRPNVSDLGLALIDSDQEKHAGEVAGTVAYMSPEQCSGRAEHLDGRADLWAVGVILYQLLTGQLPFTSTNLSALIDEILHREPKPLRMIDGRIPEAVEAIVKKCLAKQPADRYGCGNDLAVDLQRISRDNSMVVHQDRRWMWLLGIAGVLLAIGAGGLLYNIRFFISPSLPETVTEQLSQSLKIKQFDVFLSPKETDSQDTMLILGRDAFACRTNDAARIQVELNRQAYCFLLALNPDHSVTLAYPHQNTDETDHHLSPQKTSRIVFPMNPGSFYEFSDGPGQQGFLLVASESPLPSFHQWQKTHPDFQWTPPTTAMFLRPSSLSVELRGSVTKRPGTQSLTRFYETVAAYSDVDLLDLWLFPINPSIEE